MKEMKVCCLYSGGKDSNYALYWALNQAWDVKCLVTVLPKRDDSWMFHTPNIAWAEKQAQAIGLAHIKAESKGQKEHELLDLQRVLAQAKRLGVEGVVAGALASEYQRIRIEKVCEKLKLKSFIPLWHKNQKQYTRELVRSGIRAIITKVSAMGLEKGFIGNEINEEMIERLIKVHDKYGVSVVGEGGEYESFVTDAPFFRKRLEILDSAIVKESEYVQTLVIKKIKLVKKQ